MRVTPRTVFFQLHLWCGIGLGLFLLIIAATGAVLVYARQIDAWMNPRMLRVAEGSSWLPIDTLLARSQLRHPNELPLNLTIPGSSGEAVYFNYPKGDQVFVNPFTGDITGQRNQWRNFLYLTEMLHRNLLLGANGRIFMAMVSFASMVLTASGIYLWFPRTVRQLKKAFVLHGRRGRAWMVSFHNVIGIYSAAVVLILSATAIPMVVGPVRELVFYRATGSPPPPPPPKSVRSPGATRAPIEAVWRQALALMPHFRSAQIRFPIKPDDAIVIEEVTADAPQFNARSYVYIDAWSGKVLRYEPYRSQSLGERLYSWNRPVHFGRIAGPIGPLVALLGVLSVGGLCVTGGILFFRRKFFRAAP